jgi:glycosyltransferase involved in cell wall biosynthesis
MNVNAPGITVIVPTHNRPDSLKRCLEHLVVQDTDEAVEIVVVDDGSDDAGLVADVVARIPSARLIRQERRGPAAARNAGVQAAAGSVICLTDDDCEPDPAWAARLARALRDGEDVVAGTTRNGGRESRVALASQLVVEHFAEYSAIPFAASNNIGATARLLQEVPFDESYVDAGGEDRDWCERLAARGYRIAHDPGAVIVHHQPVTLRRYVSQHARYGRGSYHYHRGPRGPRRLERPRFYTNVIRRGFSAGFSVGLLVAAAQLATALGYLGESVAASVRRVRGRPAEDRSA